MRATAALALGAVGMLGTLLATGVVTEAASRRLEAQIGGEVAAAATFMAGELDRGMFGRWRDIQVLASLDQVRLPGQDPAARERALEGLKDTLADYAWIGVASTDGEVVAATDGLLVGQDVRSRPWFTAGLQGPTAQDVHEAKLLESHLGNGGEPLRFVDVATPLRGDDGAVTGVLAAHLYWDWAAGVERSLRSMLPVDADGADILIVSRDGEVLLGPAEVQGTRIELRADTGAGTWYLEDAPDGELFVGVAPTQGHREYPGLGWTVLVEREAAMALAPVRALRGEMLGWGLGLTALMAALAWLAAGVLTRPLARLAQVAGSWNDSSLPGLEAAGPREVRALSRALVAAIDASRRSRAMIDNLLEHAPAAIYAHDADGRYRLVNGIAEQAIGRDRSEVLGRRLSDLWPPEAAARLETENAAILEAGRSAEFEEWVATPAGPRLYHTVKFPLREPGAEGDLLCGMSFDITDRAQAEEHRRESEERFRGLVEASSEVVWTADAQGSVVEDSPSWRAFTGQSLETWQSSGWLEAIHPDDRERSAALWQASLARQAVYDIEYRLRRHDGVWRWVHARAIPLLDTDGRVRSWVGMNADITERKDVEDRQRQQADRLAYLSSLASRLVLDRRPAGSTECLDDVFSGLAGKLSVELFLNFLVGPEPETMRLASSQGLDPAMREQFATLRFGKGLCGTVARTRTPLILEDVQADPRPEADGIRAMGATAYAGFPILAGDELIGTIALISTSRPRFRADEIELMQTVCDLVAATIARGRLELALARSNAELENRVVSRTAELRDANTQLAETGARFRGIFDSSLQLMALLDPEGRVIEFNRTALAQHGTAREQVVGRVFWDTFPAEDDLRDRLRDLIRGAAQGRTVRVELTTAHAPGRPAITDLSVTPILDDSGQVIQLIAEARDITELKAAQAQVYEMQKMDTVGQLTGGVAHDFNNLLTPILGGLDVLRRRQAGDERNLRLIDGAIQAAERAAVLVSRLLTFARRQTLEVRPVSIGTLVHGMADLITRSLGPNIRVALDIPLALPPARADAAQLELALLNLCVNARDAMPDGGTLTIRVDEQEVEAGRIPGLAAGRYAHLAVTDTGSGMDAETLRRATEPFFTTKGTGKGTGLGLSMVHGLAAQLGGTFALSSERGQGTRAEIWLPVAADAVEPVETPDEESPAIRRIGSARILLVDDEELVRAGTADMLRDLGHEVTEAISGTQALEVLRSGPPVDAVITDHIMPGLKGADLAREIQARQPGLPVLLISGYTSLSEAEVRGLPLLHKPFRQADLAARLAELLTEQGKVVNLADRRLRRDLAE